MKSEYSYEDWYDGKICLLASSSGFIPKGETAPKKVRWAEIKKTDVEKIKLKQKEIFDSIHYAKRIQSALMPNKLQLAKELNKAKRNGK